MATQDSSPNHRIQLSEGYLRIHLSQYDLVGQARITPLRLCDAARQWKTYLLEPREKSDRQIRAAFPLLLEVEVNNWLVFTAYNLRNPSKDRLNNKDTWSPIRPAEQEDIISFIAMPASTSARHEAFMHLGNGKVTTQHRSERVRLQTLGAGCRRPAKS